MTIQGEQLRLVWKNPCRVATTGDIADLAAGAPDTVDDILLSVGDRVLVRAQTDDTENGIYQVVTVGTGSDGAWVRARDFNGSIEDDLEGGIAVFVQDGTIFWWNTFRLTAYGPVALGSDSITFENVFRGDYLVLRPNAGSETGSIFVASDGKPYYGGGIGGDYGLVDGSYQEGTYTGASLNSVTVVRSTRTVRMNLSSWHTTVLNIPAVANMDKAIIVVQHGSDGTTTLRFDPNGAETVDGATTKNIPPGTSMAFWCNGAAWFSIPYDNVLLNAGVMKDPTGFTSLTDSVLSFTDGSRTFQITYTGTGFSWWIKGVQYNGIAAFTKVIADTPGVHYIYFDGTTLSETTTWSESLLYDYALVASVYWNSTAAKAILVCDMRHGPAMDWATTDWAHRTIGPRFVSGLTLGDFTIGDGSLATHAEFSVASGEIRIEDIKVSPSAMAVPANIPILYLSGNPGIWYVKTADNYPTIWHDHPVSYNPANDRLPYNYVTGGTWSLAEVTEGYCVCVHYFATANISAYGGNIIGIQGRAEYADNEAATMGAKYELEALLKGSLPTTDLRYIGSVIFQTSTSYTNEPNCRIRNLGASTYYLDGRYDPISPASPPPYPWGATAFLPLEVNKLVCGADGLRDVKDTEIVVTNYRHMSGVGSVGIVGSASAPTITAGSGALWVKNSDPPTLMFTDDDSKDFDLIGGKIETSSTGTTNVLRGTRRLHATLNSSATNTWALRPAAEMSGALLLFKHSGDKTGTSTIDPDGGETIDGGATKVVPPDSSLFVWCDGTAWYSVPASGGVETLQDAYDGGATITTASSTDIAFTLTSGGFTVDGTGSVTFGGSTSLGSFGAKASGTVTLESTASGGGAVHLNASNVGGGLDFDAGTAGIDADSTGSINLTSSQATNYAISINATNAAGGINVDCGTGGFDLLSAEGLITITSTRVEAGAIMLYHNPVSPYGGNIWIHSKSTVFNAITLKADSTTGGMNFLTGTTPISIAGTMKGKDAAGAAVLTLESTGTGGDKIGLHVGNDSPNGVVTGLLGSLFFDGANGKAYINTDGSTAWSELGGGGVANLQDAYDGGATITTASSTDIAFTLTSGGFTVNGAGDVTFGNPTSLANFYLYADYIGITSLVGPIEIESNLDSTSYFTVNANGTNPAVLLLGVTNAGGTGTVDINGQDGITLDTTNGTVAIQGVDFSTTKDISDAASIKMNERASAPSVSAGEGAYWARDDIPSSPVFTDDVGSDYSILHYSPVKRPARLATTGNIADLAAGAPLSVDGINVGTGDRIVVWNQTTANQNGIYRVVTPGSGSDGVWIRAADFNHADKDHITAGVQVYVQDGNSYSRTTFFLTTTGAITIGSTSLEFIPMGGLARTDAASTEVIASTAFSASYNWSSAINLRDYSGVAIFFDPTNLGTNTHAYIAVQWSDDGSTISWGDDNFQQTDFNITTHTDGTFQPKDYVADLTTAGGELVANKRVHLYIPKRAGYCKIGIKGTAADGAYSVRTQRLVT